VQARAYLSEREVEFADTVTIPFFMAHLLEEISFWDPETPAWTEAGLSLTATAECGSQGWRAESR